MWKDLPVSVVSRPPGDPSSDLALGSGPEFLKLIFCPRNGYGPLGSLDAHTGGASRKKLMPANK